MNIRTLSIIFSAFLVGLFSPSLSFAHHPFQLDSSHINVVEMDWKTPHIPFNRPSAHGPLRSLFIAPSEGSRDIVELAQRYEMDFSAVIVRGLRGFGFDNEYQQFWKDISTEDKTVELLSRLDENPEVLLIAKFDYNQLPAGARQRIESMVMEGMGLVLINPINPPLRDLQEHAIARQPILSGIPLAALADLFPYDSLTGSALAEKVVQTYTYGSGRVVVLRWHDGSLPHVGGLTPATWFHRVVERRFEHRVNYYYSLIGRAMDWTAGRTILAEWHGLPSDGQVLQTSAWPSSAYTVFINWHGSSGTDGTLQAVIRDASGREQVRDSVPVNLSGGMNYVDLNLSTPPAGLNFFDVSLLTGGKVSAWATASFRIECPEEIILLATEEDFYSRRGTASGSVELRGLLQEDTELIVKAVDTYGREYARHSQVLEAGLRKAEFSLSLEGTSSMASYIEADIIRGGRTLANQETIIYTPMERDSEFLSMMWGAANNGTLWAWRMSQRVREAGFNAAFHWIYEGSYHGAAMADLTPVQIMARINIGRPQIEGWMNLFSLHLEQNYGITDPDHSLANPVIQGVLSERIAGQARHSAPFKPWFYIIGSENNFRGDFGFSPYGLKYFSGFLQRRYSTIENLNRQYGSDYYDFEDVPRQRGTGPLLPALIDHRLGIEDEWAALHGFLGDEIRKIDPEARVGAESSVIGQDQTHGITGNLERMLEKVEVWAPYEVYGDKLRSIVSDEHLVSHWWGSYYNGAPHAGIIWNWLIQSRINYHQWWMDDGFATEGMFNRNLTYRDFFKNILPDLREIDGGLGMLLTGADIISDRNIAIHYSRESFHASQSPAIPVSTDNSLRYLEHFGLNTRSIDYRYTTPRLLAEGRLTDPLAKILFIPAAMCLSEEEADTIKEFVFQGGTVVADMMPGIFNQYGRRLSSGLLDDVFGATTAGTSAMREISGVPVSGDLWGTDISLRLETNTTDAALKLSGGRALATAEGIPFIIANEYGGGRAILLNFYFGAESDVADYITGRMMEVAGVKEEYRLTNVSDEVITATGLTATSGGARLDRNNVSASLRGDVVFVGAVLPGEVVDPAPTVSWDEPMHTYNVRTGEYLGEINTVTFTPLEPTEYGPRAQVHLLSLHNQPAERITLGSGSTAERGQMFTLDIDADLGGADPKDRLLRVEIFDPEGNNRKNLRQFITLETSQASCGIHFAYNDLPGEWTITVTDLATSISADKHVTLE